MEVVAGKRVLLRTDYNVPLHNQSIADDTRIRATLPTIMALLEHRPARIAVVSHLGRPGGHNTALSLRPVATRLQELLGKSVLFVPDCVGESATAALSSLPPGGIALLENVRFHPEEEDEGHPNRAAFCAQLAALGDVLVQDAFGALHRPHASVAALPVPVRVPGLLVRAELDALRPLLAPGDDSAPPIALFIIGGAKVADKLGLLDALVPRTAALAVVGAMAFTVLRDAGIVEHIGDSLYDPSGAPAVAQLVEQAAAHGVHLILPTDFVAAPAAGETDYRLAHSVTVENAIPDSMAGMDIGPASTQNLVEAIDRLGPGRRVLWNGPAGRFEAGPQWAAGTAAIVRALVRAAARGAHVVVAGGDSAHAVSAFAGSAPHGLHVSTGGGATLELLEGRPLPGLVHLGMA